MLINMLNQVRHDPLVRRTFLLATAGISLSILTGYTIKQRASEGFLKSLLDESQVSKLDDLNQWVPVYPQNLSTSATPSETPDYWIYKTVSLETMSLLQAIGSTVVFDKKCKHIFQLTKYFAPISLNPYPFVLKYFPFLGRESMKATTEFSVNTCSPINITMFQDSLMQWAATLGKWTVPRFNLELLEQQISNSEQNISTPLSYLTGPLHEPQ